MTETTTHDKIEYEPHDDPDFVEETPNNEFHVHVYPDEQRVVPDVIIWERSGDERFRLWGFQAHGPLLYYTLHTDHRHPPEYDAQHCQKWSTFDDGGRPLTEAPSTPPTVTDLAAQVSDAPIVDPSIGGGGEGDA